MHRSLTVFFFLKKEKNVTVKMETGRKKVINLIYLKSGVQRSVSVKAEKLLKPDK